MTQITFRLPGVVEVGFTVPGHVSDEDARALAQVRAASKGIDPAAIVVEVAHVG